MSWDSTHKRWDWTGHGKTEKTPNSEFSDAWLNLTSGGLNLTSCKVTSHKPTQSQIEVTWATKVKFFTPWFFYFFTQTTLQKRGVLGRQFSEDQFYEGSVCPKLFSITPLIFFLEICYRLINAKLYFKTCTVARALTSLGFFTNSLQYKNASIANFVLAVLLQMNQINEVCNLEI